MPLKFDPDTIGFLIADVSRLLRAEFDRRTGGIGLDLTPAEARTLVNVARGGGLRQAALAERMGVEAMTLSTYLDRLEARGLVAREADPADRRAKLVRVTGEAYPVLEEIMRVSAELRADISGSFTPAELDAFRDGLKRIRRRLVAMRPDCGKEPVSS